MIGRAKRVTGTQSSQLAATTAKSGRLTVRIVTGYSILIESSLG
jgi:hypothetical protein